MKSDSVFPNGKDLAVDNQWQTILQILLDLGKLLLAFLQFAGHWLLLIVWVAWWLGGANWKKIWPILRDGAWAPVVLLCVLAALVWSQIAPSDGTWLGLVTLPNFWWQLGGVAIIAGLTLFCGYLQGVFQWTPQEISVDPPVHGDHDHHHGHDHGHPH